MLDDFEYEWTEAELRRVVAEAYQQVRHEVFDVLGLSSGPLTLGQVRLLTELTAAEKALAEHHHPSIPDPRSAGPASP